MNVRLYKNVDGKEVLVDHGIASCTAKYKERGYIVKPYCIFKDEFSKLWKSLNEHQQSKLKGLPTNDELSIHERLLLLKTEIANTNVCSVVCFGTKKITFYDKVKKSMEKLIQNVK